jgi:hypothetical protein
MIFSCPSTEVPSFFEKYPKIKYAIYDRPHKLVNGPLCNIFLITEWITLKL